MRRHPRVSIDRQSSTDTAQHKRRLLIVDPNPLTRWSVSTYLSNWFEVAGTDNAADADRLLSTGGVDALIISDVIPLRAALEVGRHARMSNPNVTAVRTITQTDPSMIHGDWTCIEKPFELAELAQLLGVPTCDSDD
ncbi:MAG: hypothetical protein CHACPFDD_03439 [Phycisphaerae bacterium]|nr:hypothetical protein [Phycisphaerae bacterium]